MYGLAYLSDGEREVLPSPKNPDIFNRGKKKNCVAYLLHMFLGRLLVSLNQPDLALRLAWLLAALGSLIFPRIG